MFDLVRLDEENETAFEILDSMWQRFGVGRAEMKVQSIVKSATRTRIIFEHVQSMLGLYESFCYNSGKDENIRRWEVIRLCTLTIRRAERRQKYVQNWQKNFLQTRAPFTAGS